MSFSHCIICRFIYARAGECARGKARAGECARGGMRARGNARTGECARSCYNHNFLPPVSHFSFSIYLSTAPAARRLSPATCRPPPVARRSFCICTCRIIYWHECGILWKYLSSITPPATCRPSPILHLHMQN